PMNLKPEQENQIRRYILGVATPDEMDRVEVDLLRGDVSVAIILLIEDELITDYAFADLPRSESTIMEKGFSATPERRERRLVAREMRRRASTVEGPSMEETGQTWWNELLKAPRQMMKWAAASLLPGQPTRIGQIKKIIVFATLLIGLGALGL